MPLASRSRSLLLVIAALAVPRIARLAHPQIWIEDDSYLSSAFMLARGLAPYRDFPLPHLPLLEALMAAVFRIAPITIRTAEIVTAIAALAGSVLVYGLGERIGGRAAGAFAALLYATNSVLFRYHVFEREVFDVVPVLAAVWIVTAAGQKGPARQGEDSGSRGDAFSRRALASGALLAVALAIKLTAFAALVAVVAQLILGHRRREAAVVAATAIGLVAALSAALAVVFGSDFLVQVFVFRAVHASFPSLGVKLDEMRYTLDIALAAGVAGAAWIVWSSRVRQWIAPVLQLASGFVFLVLLNPTYWAHTGIELLPWLALCGGALGAAMFGRLARTADLKVRTTSSMAASPSAWVCVAGAVLFVLFVSPVRNLNWEAGDGSVYGFGYRDRAEITNTASFVRSHSSEGARVATPPLIAFAANRRELVPYGELAGDITDLTDSVRRDGYFSTLANSPLRSRTFWEGVDASRERIAPVVDKAVRAKTAGAVVNYSSDDLFPVPLINVSQATLEASGYDLASITTHYEIWIPRP